jgi:hypothetical protein
MRTSRRALAFALILTVALLPQASSAFGQEREPGGTSNLWEPGHSMGWNLKNLSPAQQQRMLRSSAFINKQVPADYLKASNDVQRSSRRARPQTKAPNPPLRVTSRTRRRSPADEGGDILAAIRHGAPRSVAG